MAVQQEIEAKITASLAPAHLEVLNDSHMHCVPPDSETHFRLVVVSDRFEGQSLVKRHQAVNRILAAELGAGLRALSMQTLTPAEWERKGSRATLSASSCHGGDDKAAG